MRLRNSITTLTLTVLTLSLLPGCQSSPAAAVEGEYELKAQSVLINGIIINMADWPGSSVSVTAVDEESVTVTVDSLLLGFSTLTVPGTAAVDGRGRYSFSGSFTGQDRDISVTGTVNKGSLSLSITDLHTTPAAGRWKVAAAVDGLADISVSFYSPMITEIPLGDGSSISVEEALTLLNAVLRSTVTPELDKLRYIEITRTGYIGIALNGGISPDLEPLLQDVIQYWSEPDASRLHIYLRRTITDGLGLGISPLDAALACSVSDGSMTLCLDQQTLSPWLEEISSAINSLSYEDYIEAGSPLGDISEEEFRQLRSMASLLVTSLSIPGTELSLQTRMVPAM